jgi:nicotinamidase-related amidase
VPHHNRDLHGAVPERSKIALLLIDVINPMSFPGSSGLVRNATRAAPHIAALKQRARRARVPTIYVNDNFGRWRSDLRATLENALDESSPGRAVAKVLAPDDADYFVLKPKRSAFYGTSLDLLLSYLGAETLVLVGFATDMCIQSTAHDAFLRDFRIVIARDCVAAEAPAVDKKALASMERQLRAEVRFGARIDFRELRKGKRA